MACAQRGVQLWPSANAFMCERNNKLAFLNKLAHMGLGPILNSPYVRGAATVPLP